MSALAPDTRSGGVGTLRGCLQWQTGRQESASLYYTYNIKYLHLSGLLPSVSSCFLHTEHTGNMKQDDNILLVVFHTLQVCNLHEYSRLIFSGQ